MIRWLRVVLPPWWVLLPAGMIYAGYEAFFLCLGWLLGTPYYAAQEGEKSLLGLFGFYAFLYAIYRVWTFHPALRPDYYQWLRGTPWTSRKPLPLGPVHVVGQDVLLVGA